MDRPEHASPRMPKGAVWLCGFGAIAVAVVLGAGIGFLTRSFWERYGLAIFAVLPFLEGCVAALLVGRYRGATIGRAIGAANAGLLIGSFAVVLFAWEGIVCVVMAAPILVGMASLGAAFAFALENRIRRPRALMASYAVFAPLALYSGASSSNGWDSRCVQTSTIVRAEPEKVWPFCVALDRIADPSEPLLLVGIAHPIRVVSGAGVGARRECVLTTGTMIERISAWEPGKVLQFDVKFTPETMKETNPFGTIHPAHLSGYYECIRGRFDITPLGRGLTLITGTSWYRQRLGPAWYWGLWSDEVVHEIHRSVFAEIARRVKSREATPQR